MDSGVQSVHIVMPVYNEEAVIEQVVRATAQAILTRLPSSRLIVVNDGSRDRTAEILDRLQGEIGQLRVIHQSNGGHGPALMRGIDDTTDDYIFLMDSDNQYDVADFWKLWERRVDVDLLIGTRAKRQDPVARLVLSRCINAIQALLFRSRLTDTNSPFKLVHRRALDAVRPLIEAGTLAPSIFLALGVERMGFTCVEIPVTHLPRITGVCSVRGKLLKFCWRAGRQLLRFRKTLGQLDGTTGAAGRATRGT
jgi:dolichol-phosphate mannosyltransferase